MRWIEFVVAQFLVPEAGLGRHDRAARAGRLAEERAEHQDTSLHPRSEEDDDRPTWTARRAAAWRAWARRRDLPATSDDGVPGVVGVPAESIGEAS